MINKFLISGLPIDLRKYKLGEIYQPKVIDFCNNEFELKDFIEPFYIEQIITANSPELTKAPLTLLFVLDFDTEHIKSTSPLSVLLYYSLAMIYKVDIDSIEHLEDDKGVHLIIKNKERKVIALIDDTNFNLLCEVILNMNQIQVETNKKEIRGSEEAKRKFEQRRKEYAEKHKEEEEAKHYSIFDMCNMIVNLQSNINYDNILNWTIWQVKNSFNIINSKNMKEMLINSGSCQFDTTKTKIPNLQKDCKIKDIDFSKYENIKIHKNER